MVRFALWSLTFTALPLPAAAAPPEFDRAVAPLLLNCLDCHTGPAPKGDLDLSRKASAFSGGESGAGVVPG